MAVVEEAHYIGRSLASRWLWLFLLIAALAIAAAYQVKQPTALDIGGPTDCPWLGTSQYCLKVPPVSPGWNDSETEPATGITYRWSKAQSEILLPGLGNQPYSVTLRWAGQPTSATTPVTLTINAQQFHPILSVDYQEQTFFVPRFGTLNPDLHITIQAPTFRPTKDARQLGVRVVWVRVEPAAYGVSTLVVPAISVTLSLLVALLILYLISWRILLPPAAVGRWDDRPPPAPALQSKPDVAEGQQGGPPPAPTPQSKPPAGGWGRNADQSPRLGYALVAPAIGLLLALAAFAFSRLNLTGFAPQLAMALLWAYLFFLLVLIFDGRSTTYPYRQSSELASTRGEAIANVDGDVLHAPSPNLPQWGWGVAATPPNLLQRGRGADVHSPSLPIGGRGVGTPSPSLPQRGRGQAIAAGIFALAFALRLGGMTHPQFITSDLIFHAHHIDDMLGFFSGQRQNFFFDGQLPNGTHVPYPSAYYLLLAPLEWLFGGTTEAGMLLLRFCSALLDASVTLLLYRFTLRFGSAAALGAAFLYAVGPASFQLFSAGNHSNIFAQTMFIAALVCAAEALHGPTPSPSQGEGSSQSPSRGEGSSQRPSRGEGSSQSPSQGEGSSQSPSRQKGQLVRTYGLYVLFSVLTMLGHYGMFIAAVGITLTIGAVWLIFAPRDLRGRIWPLLGAFAVALLISYLLYYVHFNAQIGGQISGLLHGSGGRGNGYAPLALLGDILKWQGWILLPLALVGIVLLLTGRYSTAGTRTQPPPVGEELIIRTLVLAGWLLACIPLAATALFDRDTIRYNYLALPALCICGGLAMQWLAALPVTTRLGGRQLRAGVALIGVVGVVAIVNIALIWGDLVFYHYH